MAGAGRHVRFTLLAQVLFMASLAAVIAMGLTWLSERPGVRVRIDLTADSENTFDEETRGLLDALPDDVDLTIDAFFFPMVPPFTEIDADVKARFFRFLALVKESRRDIIHLTRHEPMVSVDEVSGRPSISMSDEARQRQRLLGFRDPAEAQNAVVLSYGGQRAILRMFGDVAEVDIGSPRGQGGEFVPPRLVSYRGEEAFVKGLMKVTAAEGPRVLFSWGHGERDLYTEEGRHLSFLRQALLVDGFKVGRWDSDEIGPVPADCDVLAIVGPKQPFSEAERQWVREFLGRGGRLIAAPGLLEQEGEGGTPDLLAEYGILRQAGMVCRPLIGADGRRYDGSPKVMNLSVRSQHMASHPITDPLRRGDRRVNLVWTRPLRRGTAPEGGILIDLFEGEPRDWADLPGPSGAGDAVFAEGRELRGPFTLAMISHYPLVQVGLVAADGITQRKDVRVLAVGTPEAFGNALFITNRDFLLNAFNWVAGREFRVTISSRDPERRIIPIGEGNELFWVRNVAVIGLPVLCLLLGMLRWALRRSS